MRYSTQQGAYEIDSVPGQPQVAHCHGFFVHMNVRGIGLAHILKLHQKQTLRSLGYDFATCTVCASNAAQLAVLRRAGWERLSGFQSSKSGELIEVWGWNVSWTGKKSDG